MGGVKLGAVGRCVFAMQVTDTLTFDEYWRDPTYLAKRPVRNGSRKMMVGDNIYHRSVTDGSWEQLDSHHSQPDGRPDGSNVERDTGADRVLVSSRFIYFGQDALDVPPRILSSMGYENRRGHRAFAAAEAKVLIDWLELVSGGEFNRIVSDPFQFRSSGARYSAGRDRILLDVVDPPGADAVFNPLSISG